MTQISGSKDEFGQVVVPARNDGFRIVTVILTNASPGVKKPFHCSGCGRIAFEYYSELRVIIMGEVREISRPVDVMCSRCKIMYRVA